MACSKLEVSNDFKVELKSPDKFLEFVYSGGLNNKTMNDFHIYEIIMKDVAIKNFAWHDVSFASSRFENVVFSDGEMNDFDFEGSEFINVIFRNVKFTKTSFSSYFDTSYSSFKNVTFENCVFHDVGMQDLTEGNISFMHSDVNASWISGRKLDLTIENTNFTESHLNGEFVDGLVITGGKKVILNISGKKLNNLIVKGVSHAGINYRGAADRVEVSATKGFIDVSGNVNSVKASFKNTASAHFGHGIKKAVIDFDSTVKDNAVFMKDAKCEHLVINNLDVEFLSFWGAEIGTVVFNAGSILDIDCHDANIGTLTLNDIHFQKKLNMNNLKIGTLHVINGSKNTRILNDGAEGAVVQKLMREKPGQPVLTKENVKGIHILDLL